jgi:hypothetical protein
MKALEASAHVSPVGRDSQGTIKWPHFAEHMMSELMLLIVKVPILLLFLGVSNCLLLPDIFVCKMSVSKLLPFFNSMKF